MALACFALLGYYFFTGLYCSDDTRYLIGAIKVAVGDPISVASLAERRAMFLLPGAMIYSPEVSLEWMIVPYTLLFVALGAIGYLVARQFMEPLAAASSMLLAATQPVFFLYAGAMLPDMPSTLFLIAGLLTLCLWLKAVDGMQDSHGRSAGLAFLLGVNMAMAFTIKESGLVLMPVVAGVVILAGINAGLRRFLRDVCVAGMGFVLLLCLEALLFKHVAGQWYSSVGSLLVPHDLAGFVASQGRGIPDRLHTLKTELGAHTTALFVLAGLSTMQLVVRWLRGGMTRTEALTWLALVGFWLWPLLYFTFGSASLKSYLLPVMQQRYYAPSIIPAAVLVVHLGRVGIRTLRRIFPGWIPATVTALALLCLISAPYLLRRDRGLIYGADAKEAFIQARNDAGRRYPGVPFHDVQSGWTTDLNRCRALLMPVGADGRNRLLAAIGSDMDIKGSDFGYPAFSSWTTPVLVAGHGAYMDEPEAFPWVASLQKAVAAGQVKVTLVGRYGALPRKALRGKAWLPRTAAVDGAEVFNPVMAGGLHREATPREVEMYLIEAAGP